MAVTSLKGTSKGAIVQKGSIHRWAAAYLQTTRGDSSWPFHQWNNHTILGMLKTLKKGKKWLQILTQRKEILAWSNAAVLEGSDPKDNSASGSMESGHSILQSANSHLLISLLLPKFCSACLFLAFSFFWGWAYSKLITSRETRQSATKTFYTSNCLHLKNIEKSTGCSDVNMLHSPTTLLLQRYPFKGIKFMTDFRGQVW